MQDKHQAIEPCFFQLKAEYSFKMKVTFELSFKFHPTYQHALLGVDLNEIKKLSLSKHLIKK